MFEQIDVEKRVVRTMYTLGVDVSETLSPERVCKLAAKHGLRLGFSYDLQTGWDLTLKEYRDQCWKEIEN